MSNNTVLNTNPIFILGILPRSGTNFLYNLLCLHPDCDVSAPIPEDHLVHGAHVLDNYTRYVAVNWQPVWNVADQEAVLFEYIGKGLIDFLNSQSSQNGSERLRRVVTKTPSVRNLDYFFKLFPRAHLILLVRDGRAAVESIVKSFNSNYDTMMIHWANAAEQILQFDQTTKNSDFKCLVVKYEDLWHDIEGELRRIFTFLELEADIYDFEAAINLPVRGSSEQQKIDEDLMNWEAVEKTKDFKPMERWSHWGRALHERFNWLAGKQLKAFGYEPVEYADNRLIWTVYNHLQDAKWQFRDMIRRQIFDRFSPNMKKSILRRVFKKKALVETFHNESR